MTPEAVALHAIDLLDSQVTIAVREIADDRGESAWTPYNAVPRRRLYKGGRSDGAGRRRHATDPLPVMAGGRSPPRGSIYQESA